MKLKQVKIHSIVLILAVLLMMLMCGGIASADTDNWDGTADIGWYVGHESDTSFTITSTDGLAGLAVLVNNAGDTIYYNIDATTGEYVVGSDTGSSPSTTGKNFSGCTITLNTGGDTIDLSDYQWEPIGYSDSRTFKGTFDGNDVEITGLTIGTAATPCNYQYTGLFGYSTSASLLKNIKLTNVSIYCAPSFGRVGAVVARSENYVTGCSVSGGSVNGGNNVTYIGGVAGYTSVISDCSSSCDVTGGTNAYAGGVVGYCMDEITGSSSSGAVTAGHGSTIGGLVGYAASNITECSATGTVSCEDTVSTNITGIGGLAGVAKGNVSDSYATGSVSCNITNAPNVAGLIASMDGSLIKDCYATGDVTSTGGGFVGGLIGTLNGTSTVINSYASGNVTGMGGTGPADSTGGLIGTINGSGADAIFGQVFNCYATGDVVSYNYGGGFVGWSFSANIHNCYCTGAVSGSGSKGSFIGRSDTYDQFVNDYYNTTVNGSLSGNCLGSGGMYNFTGLTTGQMRGTESVTIDYIVTPMEPASTPATTFVDALNGGMSATELMQTSTYTYKTWRSDAADFNDGYPVYAESWSDYAATAFAGGDGTALHPYQIANAAQLAYLSQLATAGTTDINNGTAYYNENYILTANINLAGRQWTPITYLNGDFDGNGKIINGITIGSEGEAAGAVNCGLFTALGTTGSGAAVHDLTLNNVYINVAGGICGGLAANNYATVTNVDVDGTIINSSSAACGGLLGYSYEDISNCTADVVVTVASGTAGGLIGDAEGCTVTDCSATGAVTGQMNVGGLIGYGGNSPIITNCYATGDVTSTDNLGNTLTGGLIGGARDGQIYNSYATGDVIGCYIVGGFIGFPNGTTVENCFATGSATINPASEVVNKFKGGFCGISIGILVNDYYNSTKNTAGYADGNPPNFMMGLSTAQMQGSANVSITYKTDSSTYTATPAITLVEALNKGQVLLPTTYTYEKWVSAASGAYPLFGTPVTSVTVASEDDVTTVNVSDTLQMSVNVTPNDATNSAVIWNVDDTAIATIDQAGVLTGVGSGTVTVTATAADGSGLADDINIAVIQPVTAITVSAAADASSVKVGNTLQMSASVQPNNAPDKSVTWSVSDTTYATIDKDSGLLTGVKAGTVTVTATAHDGSGITGIKVITVTGGSSGGSEETSTNDDIDTDTQGNTTTVSIGLDGTTNDKGVATGSVSARQMTAALAEVGNTDTGRTIVEVSLNTDYEATGISLTIPRAAFAGLANSDADGLTVKSDFATVTFDSKAIDTISGQTKTDIVISIKPADTSKLSTKDKALIGDRPVYDFSVTIGGKTISDFGGGTATITIPYALTAGEDPDKIVIYYIDDSGKLVTVPNCVFDEKTGTVSFITDHFSVYAIGYNDISFSDVSDTDWYADYVAFLAAREIINGSNGQFNPEAAITRAEFVTILANLSGADLSAYNTVSFADIAANEWYAPAVEWAYKNGVVMGANGKFDPNGFITRQDIAVMISRYADKVANLTLSPTEAAVVFTDSAKIAGYAADAVTELQQAGIISGMGGNFAPADNATRGQVAKMITLLLRQTVD